MPKSKYTLSIIMPSLNEEKNIQSAISNTLKAFDDFNINGEVIVVNDGSTDKTPELVTEFIQKDKRVRLITHDSPQGIGSSFWDGVDNANGEIVSMFPGDNENDPWEVLRYYELLDHVDMIIPFVFNKQVRSLFRNVLSLTYRFIINTSFLVYFNYTNGTIVYRKSILDELDHKSSGFFFQTDILIRTVKKGYLFAEVPYRLGVRKTDVSKAVTFPSLFNVIKGYLNLVNDFYSQRNIKETDSFSKNSLTEKRRQQNK